MALFEKEKEEFIESYDKNGLHTFSEKVGDVTNAMNELGWYLEDGNHLKDDDDNSLVHNVESLTVIKDRFEELLNEMQEMKDIISNYVECLDKNIAKEQEKQMEI